MPRFVKWIGISPVLRKLIWRLGRALYTYARGDAEHDPRCNGEYWFLEQVLHATPAPHLLLDVGANRGDWTAHALESPYASRELRIYAFEPSEATRHILSARFAKFPSVTIYPHALSDNVGQATFYSSVLGAGTNSLSAVSGENTETVQLITIDAFLETLQDHLISMVKIDTEGFDLPVLQGAQKSLSEGRIQAVQFEYNWRWLINHGSLRDVFELIKDKPYRLGKLVGDAIEFYEKWHFELDRYFQSNYVLARSDSTILHLGKEASFDQTNAVTIGGTVAAVQSYNK